jgi:N-acetylmuramoyl-L-alanine amidase
MRYKIVSVSVFFLLFSITLLTLPAFKPQGKYTVVIDAGHGGHDPGCQYGGAKEKDITLAIALKLGKLIKENCKDVEVIFTRQTDSFVELWERADIANRNNADVFISVHVNANAENTKVTGTETYTMGLHKTKDNLEVAKRENSVVLLESDYNANYDGFDPKSPEGNIIFQLYQNNYCTQSIRFADKIEGQLTKGKRKSRGVKQAGFVVLWKTAMPSVLIETGFLSNTEERKFLVSASGQNGLANAIYKAFIEFKGGSPSTRN